MLALPWRLAPDCTHDCASAATGWIVINLVPRFRNAPALCAIREYPQPSAAFALMEGKPLTFPQDHRILADFTPYEILRITGSRLAHALPSCAVRGLCGFRASDVSGDREPDAADWLHGTAQASRGRRDLR